MGGIRWVLVSRLLLPAEPPGCAPDLWAIAGELYWPLPQERPSINGEAAGRAC